MSEYFKFIIYLLNYPASLGTVLTGILFLTDYYHLLFNVTVRYKTNKTKFQINRYDSFGCTLYYLYLHHETVFVDGNNFQNPSYCTSKVLKTLFQISNSYDL
jgi:hypothetical protein